MERIENNYDPIDIEESYFMETKSFTAPETLIEERLNKLYDIVEKLEYRIAELENKDRKYKSMLQ